LEKGADVKPEDINRAIAEHFGADCMTGSGFATWPMQAGEMLRKIALRVAQSDECDERLFSEIPRFSTDLNAMHEAEKELTDEQYLEFSRWLMDECQEFGRVWRHSSASAGQRAECFLRTIGKWRDE